LFQAGADYLLKAGEASSTGYLLVSALFIVAAILPWCMMMGATVPLMMSFIAQTDPANRSSFSFLYLANVIGAMAGTAVTALFLVELFGLRGTSMIAATINFLIAAIGFALARLYPFEPARAAERPRQMQDAVPAGTRAPVGTWTSNHWLEVVLFTTGFTSLAMEVAWTRAFTFVLKTTIYSFAMILTTYLLATWIGSYLYRRSLKIERPVSTESVLGALCIFALLPVVLDDPRANQNVILTLASIVPFCLALGYLTPGLIDAHANPAIAGRSYGVNIAGGILGPLVAAYILLPAIGTRATLIVLSVPMFLLFGWTVCRVSSSLPRRLAFVLSFGALVAFSVTVSRGYEDGVLYEGPREVRRDYVATVMAYGEGMDKQLLVNGIGMTSLTPITKVMAHLPLAMKGDARSGLVICFGMGTTFRAMHSWGIDATAVELSRSVFESFGFFFPDFAAVITDPKAHIVVDDGRRYLPRKRLVAVLHMNRVSLQAPAHPNLKYLSPDPTDPAVTVHVITVMLADEY
jgi:spermidine synthase